ncbi:amidohydrolase family protein [Propionispora vibrioides]|uniref:Amidohydrolase-related domain-containing protein n=1 Tax=Propionispora vibrioides TaxID=112903 RepID=A0A1H8XPM0_9FIRM|nr:amidohydrolase family protein [Propionispora vibrioides]SEP41835.1 hypothetical protein SAMN04490178_12716 [Propionispora vibrioides]
MTMRIITLEEHFASPDIIDRFGRQSFHNKDEQLCDLNERRIAEMDAAGIDLQVLSLTSPGTEALAADEAVKIATSANDFLAAAIERHPSRFAGFATLPTAAPELAVAELERMVCQHGFRGAVINGHIQGRYLDDEFFWPIMERAEALQVPLYLHPAPPPQPVIDAYYTGNFSAEVTRRLSTAGWGWHIETAVHILRLILSGVFDRYPKLQFIIGHMGEALPFMLPRIDLVMQPELTKLQRPVAAYLRENIHYTFSGFNFTAAFLNLLLEVGVDRIMFSADYPYGSMERGRAFLAQLPVSSADREKIAHGNAERLLHL